MGIELATSRFYNHTCAAAPRPLKERLKELNKHWQFPSSSHVVFGISWDLAKYSLCCWCPCCCKSQPSRDSKPHVRTKNIINCYNLNDFNDVFSLCFYKAIKKLNTLLKLIKILLQVSNLLQFILDFTYKLFYKYT